MLVCERYIMEIAWTHLVLSHESMVPTHLHHQTIIITHPPQRLPAPTSMTGTVLILIQELRCVIRDIVSDICSINENLFLIGFTKFCLIASPQFAIERLNAIEPSLKCVHEL